MRIPSCSLAGDLLSARGMVRRVTAEDDHRAVALTVTEGGRQAVLAWQATGAAVLNLALYVAGQAATGPGRRGPALDTLALAVDRLADMHGN